MGSLNAINYLNVVGFAINVFFTFFAPPSLFGIVTPGQQSGVLQTVTTPTNSTLASVASVSSLKHLSPLPSWEGTLTLASTLPKFQTLITPTVFVFTIWGVIFLSQGIFAIAQLIGKYRSIPLIQVRVSYWYFVACIAQSGWMLLFGMRRFILSSIVIFIVLYALIQIIAAQRTIFAEDNAEYWFFKFPFEIHCGWIMVAAAINVNEMAISLGAGSTVQTIFAMTILIVLFITGLKFFIRGHTSEQYAPNYVIPGTIALSMICMCIELAHPAKLVVVNFPSATRLTTMIIAIVSIVILCCCIIPFLVFLKCRDDMKEKQETNPLLHWGEDHEIDPLRLNR